MKFISTRNTKEETSFKTAVIKGLAANGGLYVPETIPVLPPEFYNKLQTFSNEEIAFQVLKPFVGEDVNDDDLKKIISDTLCFDIPVKRIKDSVYALELFHGPTHAFKDVGARFISRCMAHFGDPEEKVFVLVATSGDTGSAVANGFYKVPGTQVVVLFPRGGVSDFQEYQMAGLGENITAVEVEGTFDDCQALVKQAFGDKELNAEYKLSSANSINIARLLPQMLYYFFAYRDVQKEEAGKQVVFSVPSGNFGNITAGLMAKRMGLPVSAFIASTNANDTFPNYLETGQYEPKPSVATFSNAMDVGAPSNFERLLHFFDHDLGQLKQEVFSFSFSDTETLQEINKTYKEQAYLLCPHSAIGKMGLEKVLKPDQTGVVLCTAHPKKFAKAVAKAIPGYETPVTPDYVNYKKYMPNCYPEFKSLINLL